MYICTHTRIGMIQRRLAWPLLKDDMQICEAFIFLDVGQRVQKSWVKNK